MSSKEIRQKKKDFVKSLKDSGILAMRKFIFLVLILLLPMVSTTLSFAQNSINVYASDISIIKFFKFDKAGAKKDFYIQLSENITNIFNYYPRHLAFYRFDYSNSQIITNSHNGALNNSAENCLQAGIIYGSINQFKISSRDTNIILRHVIPATCFEPADRLSLSTNNGANWSNVYSNGFTIPLFKGLDIDPTTDSIMYCIYKRSGADSLFRTTNKGQTWQAIRGFSSNSLPGYTDCLISVSAFNHNVIFVKSSSGLVRSSDFGNTFSNVTLPSVNINSFEYDKIDNIIYITTKGATPGIFKSADEGLSWVRLFDKPCQSMEIDPLNNNFLFAGSVDGLYRSTKKGLDWLLYNNSFLQSKNVIGVSKSSAMGDTVMVVTDKAIYKVYGEFKSFTDYNYFPLKIGNSWTYETTYELPPGTNNTKVTIVSDTVINSIKYYKTSGRFPGFTSSLIRLDSLTGNIFCYSESPSCARYPQRLLMDSLAGRINDTVRRCHNPQIGIVTDTSNYSLPWQTVKAKEIYYTSLVDQSHTYGKGFGLVDFVTSEGTSTPTRLKGCIIDGIMYGDTAAFSPFTKYLPLKVGNLWVYEYHYDFNPGGFIKVRIKSDTLINTFRYFKTSSGFSSNFPGYGNYNIITVDTVTGNILAYDANASCPGKPKHYLIDSLAGQPNNFYYRCETNISNRGTCGDTGITTIFGESAKTKRFFSPFVGVQPIPTYGTNFGIISATTNEVDNIYYQLKGCIINGVVYGDTSGAYSISGIVRFNDNNQPASNGYVKALKLNTSTGNIITYDSTQIGIDGTYNLHVPSDLYYIVAYPNSEKQADFVPTYYPSTISWQSAVKVNSANSPSNVNISVYRKTNMGGAYSVNGWVTAQTNNLITGVKEAIIYVKHGNNFRDFFITQSSGQYNLNSLLSGNYEVVADRLGYVGAHQNITVTNGNLENINFALIRVGINTISNLIPDKFSLYQNYPNPFNPVTNIKFDIPKSSFVTLKVYNVLGKEETTILNENKNAGSYEVDFNASAFTSGVYYYRIETESFTETKRMVILK